MSRVGVIALAVVLVLAGCYGFVPWLGDDEPDRAPATVETDRDGDPTVSPTATDDTETATRTRIDAGPDYLAPGLTAEGVLNVSALLERHFAILERESGNGTYVTTFRSDRTALDLTRRKLSSSRERYVVQYPEYWYQSWTQFDHTDNETTAYEEWHDESDALLRADLPDEPVGYDAQDVIGTPGHPWYLEVRLTELLQSVDPRRSVNVSVQEQGRDGTTVYVVTHTSRRGSTAATSTFFIREDGFITRYSGELIYASPPDGTTITRRSIAFDIRPNGTLESPDWIEAAREEANDEGSNDD